MWRAGQRATIDDCLVIWFLLNKFFDVMQTDIISNAQVNTGFAQWIYLILFGAAQLVGIAILYLCKVYDIIRYTTCYSAIHALVSHSKTMHCPTPVPYSSIHLADKYARAIAAGYLWNFIVYCIVDYNVSRTQGCWLATRDSDSSHDSSHFFLTPDLTRDSGLVTRDLTRDSALWLERVTVESLSSHS